MNLVRVNDVPYNALEAFLHHNPHVDGTKLAGSGYAVLIGGKIEGCFVLEQVESGCYWLKQLYIAKQEAAKLPILLEAILVLAKEKEAKQVRVHSHQPVVDLLLEALQFCPQKGETYTQYVHQDEGSWWVYQVS